MDAEFLIRLILGPGPGSAALRAALRRRDRWRRLQIDASQVNIYLIEDIEALFPNSRYILTIRRPALWLRSMIDDSLRRETSETWKRFRDFRFGTRGSDGMPRGEEALAEAGLYTLAGYLKYWSDAVTSVLDRVPEKRRLIVPTEKISVHAPEIARFSGVPNPESPPSKSHSFRNTFRSGLLSRLDQAHLTGQLETHAGPAARRVFSGWNALRDLEAATRDQSDSY